MPTNSWLRSSSNFLFLGGLDVLRVLVAEPFDHARHGPFEQIQLVDRQIEAAGDAVHGVGQHAAVAAARHLLVTDQGEDRDQQQTVEIASRHFLTAAWTSVRDSWSRPCLSCRTSLPAGGESPACGLLLLGLLLADRRQRRPLPAAPLVDDVLQDERIGQVLVVLVEALLVTADHVDQVAAETDVVEQASGTPDYRAPCASRGGLLHTSAGRGSCRLWRRPGRRRGWLSARPGTRASARPWPGSARNRS